MKRYYLIIAFLILLTALCVACATEEKPSHGGVSSSDSSATEQPTDASTASATLPSTTTTAPATVLSTTTIPTTMMPTTTVPVTTVPVTSATTVATTTAPVTTLPVTTAATTTLPETKPVTKPALTTVATTPVTKPVTTKPITTKPVTTKPITTIPVTTTEPITERPSTLVTPEVEPDKDELVKVADYIPSIKVDLRYAGSDNLAGTLIYDYTDAYLRYGTVRRLAAVQEDLLEEGYSLLIWDAYRPLSAQWTLSVVLPEKATSPVQRTIAYNNGDTLSVSIVDKEGNAIAIPFDFDCNQLTSTHDNSSKAKANAERLADAMTAHGFEPYLSDWYRFTDRDEYVLDPTLTIGEEGIEDCPEWTVVCNESISLRTLPDYDAEVITTIPNGRKVKLIYFAADFAYVKANGQYGFAVAGYLSRGKEGEYQSELEVVEPSDSYTYEQMQADLKALAEKFPDRLRISSIGESEEGLDLTLAIMGNESAERKVFLQSSIHARENIVTTLTVAQIDYMLHHQDETLPDGSMTVGELLDEVCFHIVPMSNPDGVKIVQTGKVPPELSIGYDTYYASVWKANAKGIDLNANFDADWEDYASAAGTNKPSYMGYKGTAPECAAESKALADYLRETDFDLILSYHTSGSVIYWSYGGDECMQVNMRNYDLSRRLAVLSNFTLNGQPSISTAGLKDWAIKVLKTPSLTIEFASSPAPVALREFDQIWLRSRDMLSVCGKWVLDQ